MMNEILFITPHLGGGAGKAISGLIRNIDFPQKKLVLLEEPESQKYCDLCKEAGIQVMVSSDRDKISSLAEQVDIVVFNWWAHPLSVGMLDLFGDIDTRLIIWSHINGLHYPVLTPEFLSAFDGMMFTSPCTVKNPEWSENDRQTISEKCAYIYGTGEFSPQNAPHKTDYSVGQEVKIGYIGTLDFSKLNPAFPKICSEIIKRVPEVRFVLCGRYTEEFAERLFDGYPELKSYIEFKGFVNDPEIVLAQFDIFCYPLSANNYATTENALLEAMASALPVVVLDNPAEKEIVENNITGITATTIDEFTEKTILLCRDTELRQKLGTSARKMVIDKYSTSVNSANFMGYISKLSDTEKHRHFFSRISGDTVWKRFLYFCGNDRDKIIRLMNGEKIRLPDIFYSESKGSPGQYMKYFDDKKFMAITEKM